MTKVTIHNSYIPADNQITSDLNEFKNHSAPPNGYQRVSNKNLPPEASSVARSLLKGEFGTLTPFEIDDRSFIARVEPHYHKPGGKARPWGVHKGVSVFESSSKKPTLIEDDYVEETGLLSKLNKFLEDNLS